MKEICNTKIIATIGPSSWDKEILSEMYHKGMRLARVNASFADSEEISRVAKQVREISPRIGLILDTQGTKIRVTNVTEVFPVKDIVCISSTKEDLQYLEISYPEIHKIVTIGTRILLDDGTIELKVKEIKDTKVYCETIQEGMLKSNKTVNIPDIPLSFPILTEKDKQDIHYAIKNDYDFISVSFVRNVSDIYAVREIIGNSDIKIIAKIENRESLEHIDEIIKAVDAIMIARGDLGVETSLWNIPIIQKQVIYKCRAAGKPVIVATQLLESMRENKKPTRAEVSDVSNAIMDGADSVMLSAETSTGKNPVEAVDTINKIALNTEKFMQPTIVYGETDSPREVDELAKSIFSLSNSIPLKAVIILSNNPYTIGSISRHRPNVPIWSISSSVKRIRQDSIYWGIISQHVEDLPEDRDEALFKAIQTVYTFGELALTDKIAIITGSSIKNKENDLVLEIATTKDILDK